MTRLLRTVNWEQSTATLVDSGSVQLKNALDEALLADLLAARQAPWKILPEYEGVVRQIGSAAYQTIVESADVVSQLAQEITREVRHEINNLTPAPTPFNEVSWSHYPAGDGHITAHRDPDVYTGLLAILTLAGSATFRVWGGNVLGHPNEVTRSRRSSTDWTAAAGDVVIIRGNRWPHGTDRCPVHEALAPTDGERVIMTFRSNSHGAGAGYTV